MVVRLNTMLYIYIVINKSRLILFVPFIVCRSCGHIHRLHCRQNLSCGDRAATIIVINHMVIGIR